MISPKNIIVLYLFFFPSEAERDLPAYSEIATRRTIWHTSIPSRTGRALYTLFSSTVKTSGVKILMMLQTRISPAMERPAKMKYFPVWDLSSRYATMY